MTLEVTQVRRIGGPTSNGGKVKRQKKENEVTAKPKNKKAKKKAGTDYRPTNEPSTCYECSVVENSKADKKLAQSWIQCSRCFLWCHEPCGEINGILDDDDFFVLSVRNNLPSSLKLSLTIFLYVN